MRSALLYALVLFHVPLDARAGGSAEMSAPAPYERLSTLDKLGRRITYYVATPRAATAPLPLAVFVQGSGCDSQFRQAGDAVVGRMQELLRQAVRDRARVMVVEKPGVKFLDEARELGVAEGCPEVFLQEHTLTRWAEAVGAAVRAAAKLPGSDPRRLLIVGHSEGGIVAARVASENAVVTHVASLAGGGPSQLFDFVAQAGKRGEDVYRTFSAIKQDPQSITKFWYGHPYRRWSSFMASSVLDGLLRTEARVFIAHGTDDQATTVASFDMLRAELTARGKQVTAERISGVGHMFCKNNKLSPDGMRALLERVYDWFLS